jgi:diguanylate cyclase (GGDEF)-like protein
MLFRRPKLISETTQILQGLGLSARDVSESGLAVLERLTAELSELKAKLEIAEALADRDTLSPVLNRRAFLRELHRTMSEVERYRTPASVLYIDLDGFKSLNDAYGHSAGDAILRNVGLILLDSVRESDVVGRLGGDEFGVILNRATAEEGATKAQSLSDKVNSSAILYAGVPHRIRASVGVHPIAIAEDPETALARADEAMYAEKHARRAQSQAFSGF